ncbi:protein O-mannosyltransferase 1 [Culicoides brevitarsis]|uniref:protein O-mannosyltransferase 1 n=1 Tax=Culicoides brevitarsis TaxID=469753 RepID=UPI00307B298E
MSVDAVRKRKNRSKASAGKEEGSDSGKDENKNERLVFDDVRREPVAKQAAQKECAKKIDEEGESEIDAKNALKVHEKVHSTQVSNDNSFMTISISFDVITLLLFLVSFVSRMWKLWTPNNVVFDEMHYGKYVSFYMRNVFFFDQHPPLGKQLIAATAFLTGYDGNYTFDKIGAEYTPNVPIFALRFVPALCGALLAPMVYKLLLQMKVSRISASLGGALIILDNALLTQSRFMLMESMLILFSVMGILFLMKFLDAKPFYPTWWLTGTCAALFISSAISVKYVGVYAMYHAVILICRRLWDLLKDRTLSDFNLGMRTVLTATLFAVVIVGVYLTSFYYHLTLLHKAGPHDSVLTSAFQASLDGGLASITKGQPVNVVHGSQITLRHTHGRTCWLHSHAAVYPVKYADNRGSSHQQQVTCYSFKDVNNWWIVKKPDIPNLVVAELPEEIRDGDEIQLVHGITSRALNSHDVAAPMSPQCQEVSCYIDYNISMPAQNLWRVDIINKQEPREIWHAITSQVRLIHVTTGLALRFSGKQLPDWGFNQHEIVADKIIDQPDTVWNVEEHRYTKGTEIASQIAKEEMIPMAPTRLTFTEKFMEIQMKMLWYAEKTGITHMYSSEVFDWPLMNKGIAYWVAKDSNAQIHLLGNIVIWYSGTLSLVLYFGLLVFYILRRCRQCYDLTEEEFVKFTQAGEVFMIGYLINFLPFFFVERILFLHYYLPALTFKIMLLTFVIDHLHSLLAKVRNVLYCFAYDVLMVLWFIGVVFVFVKFSVLSYGTTKLSETDIVALRWKDTWDFILHKDLS